MNGPIEKTSSTKPAADAAPTNVNHVLNRSKAMHLMNEDMARAHSALRLEELLRHERSRRVVRWFQHLAELAGHGLAHVRTRSLYDHAGNALRRLGLARRDSIREPTRGSEQYAVVLDDDQQRRGPLLSRLVGVL